MKLLLQRLTISYLNGSLPIRKAYSNICQANRNEPDLRVIQTFSSACRSSWYLASSQLGVAKLLRNLDDIDFLQFKSIRSNKIGFFMLLLAGFPFFAYTLFGDACGDILVDMFLPTLSSGFIIANSYLFTASSLALLLVYVVGGTYLLWRKGFFNILLRSVSRKQANTKPTPIGGAGKLKGTVSIVRLHADNSRPSHRRNSLYGEWMQVWRRWWGAVCGFGQHVYDVLYRKPDLLAIAAKRSEERIWANINQPKALQAMSGQFVHKYTTNSVDAVGQMLQRYLAQDESPVMDISPPKALPMSVQKLRVGYVPEVVATTVNDHATTTANIEGMMDASLIDRLLARHLLHCTSISPEYQALPGEVHLEQIEQPKLKKPRSRAHMFASSNLSAADLCHIVLVAMIKLYLEKGTKGSKHGALLRNASRAVGHGLETDDLAAEQLLESGIEHPFLIGDLQFMMREVWSKLPMNKHLRSGSLDDGLEAHDFLTEEEVHELIQDFNIWIHSIRTQTNDHKITFPVFKGYMMGLVEKMLSVRKRLGERTQAKIRQVIQEKKKRLLAASMDEEDERPSDLKKRPLRVVARESSISSRDVSDLRRSSEDTPPAIVVKRMSFLARQAEPDSDDEEEDEMAFGLALYN